MAYKGFTEKHRQGNERYLRKFVTKSVRISKTAWDGVERHYTAAGHDSFNSYVITLINADMGVQAGPGAATGIQGAVMDGHSGPDR